jgi:hypothetical protein
VLLLSSSPCCSPLHHAFFFSVSNYYSPLCLMLLLSSLPYCFPLHVALLLSFLHHVVAIFFTSCYYSPLHATLLFSFSCCIIIILFAMLLSFSPYCFPLCAPLLSSSPYSSSILGTRFFMLPLWLVCCYSLKNLVLRPCILSCKN